MAMNVEAAVAILLKTPREDIPWKKEELKSKMRYADLLEAIRRYNLVKN
jgi:hypothetical protein